MFLPVCVRKTYVLKTVHKTAVVSLFTKTALCGIVRITVIRTINSAVECYLHTVEVTGSNPVSSIDTYNNRGVNERILSFRYLRANPQGDRTAV